jgi:hypothetical protein
MSKSFITETINSPQREEGSVHTPEIRRLSV